MLREFYEENSLQLRKLSTKTIKSVLNRRNIRLDRSPLILFNSCLTEEWNDVFTKKVKRMKESQLHIRNLNPKFRKHKNRLSENIIEMERVAVEKGHTP